MDQTEDIFRPTVLDLFSGAGGLAYGFRQAGFHIKGGIDLSLSACSTFERNLEAKTLRRDLRRITDEELTALVGGGVDVMIGGPSCQGYSTSGGLSRTGGRDIDDPRNKLFLDYLRLVDHLRPSWIVFENVPGLLLFEQGRMAREIVSAFAELGYRVLPMILLAADYGVPQLRRRLVFVGNRTGSRISFPSPTHGNPSLWANYALPFAHLSRLGHGKSSAKRRHVSFASACGDLPEVAEGKLIDDVPYPVKASTQYQREMRRGSVRVHQHEAATLSPSDRFAVNHLSPGQNWRDLPEEFLPARFRRIRPYDATTLFRRLKADHPAYTITTKFGDPTAGAFIHPVQARTLTVREAARLQSFPDRFIFDGTLAQVCRQIGNAVPPLLARAVAEAIWPAVMRDVFGTAVKPVRETVTFDSHEADVVKLIASGRRSTAPVVSIPVAA